ncbi:MAG: kdpD [Herminiimonas sp.]|nr:kdpD [Herminiimonas sp.]
MRNFFRSGNSIALSDLVPGPSARRVTAEGLASPVEKPIDTFWKTKTRLLACVGVRPDAESVVRNSARLASQLNAEWHAVYVETPRLQRLPERQREQILRTLKLASELGATTAVLSGNALAPVIVEYARDKNISRVILGRGPPRLRWRETPARQVTALAPDLDLIELGRASANATCGTENTPSEKGTADSVSRDKRRGARYLGGAAASLLTALFATPLLPYFDLANIVMLFLLTVVLVAVRLGQGAAIVSTLVGVAAFDYFFVPPRFSLAITDFQYLVTFGVMLAVGLITSRLMSNLLYQAHVAAHRESRSRALYEFARALSGVLETAQIFDLTRDFIDRSFRVKATLLLPDAGGRLQLPRASQLASIGVLDLGIAQWAFDHAQPAGIGTDTLPGTSFFYLPLRAPMRTRGILVIAPESRRWILIPEQRQQLDTFATLAAIALERVHYVEVAQEALLHMESERLRNSLLSALSHDLRTPLTSLVGMSESLAMARPPLPPAQQELAQALHDESLRMSKLVANLLDMARIESGEVRLNLEWQSVEEVVGTALRASRPQLTRHEVVTALEPRLPLARFDAVLIERVLCNLVENAAKYTPPGSRIEIAAVVKRPCLEIAVCDNGPGLPQGREEALFEKFVRGEHESATPGVGLGLAICRAIVKAHGGEIHAQARAGGGACFRFTLPLGTPPAAPEPEEERQPLLQKTS